MKTMMRLTFALLASLCLLPAWGSAAPATQEECIDEPIFEGKVCTLQANPDAATGVILIHGLGGSIDDWKNVIPVLAKNFHVLAFDLPGFGKSDKGSQDYSPTHYAQLARFLVDHYFVNKPYHIVGHSMGGAIALRFAALRPLRFQRLVLIDVAGILHPQVISKFQAGSLLERGSGIQETRSFAERISGRVLEQVDRLPISPMQIANNALGREYLLQGGPAKIAALELAGEDFSKAIATVPEPTLILWGDHDLTVPIRTGHVLAARMPHARLEIIHDAAHEPMQDQPERTNALIERHLLSTERELAQRYRPAPPLPALTSERTASCSGSSGMEFEGDYRSIEISDCSNVTIRNARIVELNVLNSRMEMIDTDITNKDVALHAYNSDITITNGNIAGTVAIKSERSRFDLAGVRLTASRDAVEASGSKFVFSVSQVHSSHMDGTLHVYKKMDGTL